MAEIAVFLDGLQKWEDATGWCTWIALYKPEIDQDTPAAGKQVESTTYNIGLFQSG